MSQEKPQKMVNVQYILLGLQEFRNSTLQVILFEMRNCLCQYLLRSQWSAPVNSNEYRKMSIVRLTMQRHQFCIPMTSRAYERASTHSHQSRTDKVAAGFSI